ncbi:hypothetical protein FVEN_g7862 [Fusarium venenatum]|uniref:Uncharacterized protein n=1 Tax=Fusarium venenatum TaxID=56646 RepID=A0A2L2TT16_9HYPO|nr:uncharacterized protein FVRRES_08664 [Fusarium venenatum]KAG8354125.1 hypothetical protein FVEN_g7862 [Fusarium venenatum]KAH6965422.1 hypothetical protein EDB82DRAFT_298319 [Fusarium venenatum]CEI68587.1 unnamed protein product [Fusarium venenatum]
MAPLPTIYVRQSVASGADSVDGRSVPGEAVNNRHSSLEPREKIPGLNEDTVPPPQFAGSDHAWDSPLSGYDIPKRNRHARASAPNTINSRRGIDFSQGFVFDDGVVYDVDEYESKHSGVPTRRPVGPPGHYDGRVPTRRPVISDPPCHDDGRPPGGVSPGRYDSRPPGGGSVGRPEPMTHDPAIDLTPGRVPVGEVGPPGPSFMDSYGNMIYAGVGVVVLAVGGFFGFKWWKKKKAAAAEAAE